MQKKPKVVFYQFFYINKILHFSKLKFFVFISYQNIKPNFSKVFFIKSKNKKLLLTFWKKIYFFNLKRKSKVKIIKFVFFLLQIYNYQKEIRIF